MLKTLIKYVLLVPITTIRIRYAAANRDRKQPDNNNCGNRKSRQSYSKYSRDKSSYFRKKNSGSSIRSSSECDSGR